MIKKVKTLVLVLLISNSFIFSQELINVNSVTAKATFNYLSEETSGEIENISAKILIDTNDLSNSLIEGKANINFLSTSNGLRDKHLKSKTYFNIKEYAEIEFKSNEIIITKTFNDSIAPIITKGTLQMKGFKKEITFRLFYSDKTITLKSEIYADDFGVAIKPDRENSLVTIEIIIDRE